MQDTCQIKNSYPRLTACQVMANYSKLTPAKAKLLIVVNYCPG